MRFVAIFLFHNCQTPVRLQPGEITGIEAYFVPLLDEK